MRESDAALGWKRLSHIILLHSQRYPAMEALDYVKLLYQNEFGCGHFVREKAAGEQWLMQEYEAARAFSGQNVDPVGNGFLRIPLSSAVLSQESLPLLNQLFAATANYCQGDSRRFREKISLLLEMASSRWIPLNRANLESYWKDYQAAGCPPVHHSDRYRLLYHPHYRVIREDYWRFWTVFQTIRQANDKKKDVPFLVAVDGRCGSGKSYLSRCLKDVFHCPIVPMDDFFLPPVWRTRERLDTPGENIHHERFLQEVLQPLSKGEPAAYRPFDCTRGEYGDPVLVPAAPLVVIEGSYALHPNLVSYYDLCFFVTCSKTEQLRRLRKRETEDSFARFVQQWIPLEERYFDAFAISSSCHSVIDTEEPMDCEIGIQQLF